jgi:SAM-dependent methyltransferase
MEAELFDEMWNVEQHHWWFVGRRRVVASLVDRHAPTSREGRLRVCELGCGTGGNLAYWKESSDVCGMDVSEKALEYARQRVGARVELGSLPDDVPFEASSFDLVLMTDVLEHIEDDMASAPTALSLLKNDGIFVATVPAHQWLFSLEIRITSISVDTPRTVSRAYSKCPV